MEKQKTKELTGQSGARAPGTLFVISAPSGAGKTSLIKALVEGDPGVAISVSHTTRTPRPGETDGRDYHFIDEPGFRRMAEAGEFLEYARVFDYFYGTSRAEIDHRLAAATDVVLEIDWQGSRQIRAVEPAAVSVFVLPPSVETLRRRLVSRAQDDGSVIERRMRDALNEISHYDEYDFVIVNDDFEAAVEDLRAIVRAHRLRIAPQRIRHQKLIDSLLLKG